MYEEVTSVCEKVLSEEKSPRRRAFLSVVAKDLAGIDLNRKKGENTRNDASDWQPSATETQSDERGLGESELGRLGFSCRLVLLGNCGSRLSTKNLTTSLEFATVILDSGLIPTFLLSTPPDLGVPSSPSGGAGDFFSKFLGVGAGATRRVTRAVPGESDSAQGGSNNGVENVFIAIVEAVIAVSRHIQGRDVNERLLFTLVTALQASVVPRRGRTNLSEKPRSDYRDHFLAVQGELLLLVVEELFGILKRNNVILPLLEKTKSALNYIAKALSKAVEHEVPDVGEVEQALAKKAERGYQVDAAKLLEYCSGLAKSSVLPSTFSQEQGNNLSFVVVPSETSVLLLTALNFILHLAVNGGPVFRNSNVILLSLKSTVIPCTLGAALLKDLDTFRLSVNVLLTCAINFGHLMVNEISTIFCHLFFRVLELKSSSLAQKSIVVEAFYRYIEEPQNLIALFLNYDCNTSSLSLYEQMIGHLAALSISPEKKNTRVQNNIKSMSKRALLDSSFPESLQRSALTTLLLVAYSNRQWIERFECDQNMFVAHASLTTNLSGKTDSVKKMGNVPEFQGNMTLSEISEGGKEKFFQILRIKDAFRKFLYYINEAKNLEAAIEFLKNEPLLLLKIPDGETKNENSMEGIDSACNLGPLRDSEIKLNACSKTLESPEEKMEREAQEIAFFLKDKEDYIDKLVLGEYFAKSFRKSQAQMIFVKWIEQHSFAGMTLDVALRLFLGGFKLIGEAEVVDKTMELFAAQYCRENPTAFRSANTAFILSFSICMLNTDAHSPHVKNKMTLDEFIRNNKGIDEGDDVEPALLSGIYERIVSNEIKLRSSKFMLSFSKSRGDDKCTPLLTKKMFSGLLETIPVLRHFAPVARAITDSVMIPLDVAGNVLFNTVQRKQEEIYQAELREALKDVIEALDTTNAFNFSFVRATKIENAIPMWGMTVDHVVQCLIYAFENFFTMAETTSFPLNTESNLDVTSAFVEAPENREYFDILLRGVVNTVSVCCSFGNISHAEDLIERLFKLTQLESVVIVDISRPTAASVRILNAISKPRIELLATVLSLFLAYGASLTTTSWCLAYTGVSLIDLISNGIEGIWNRQCKKGLSSGGDQPPPDAWFGNLDDIPPSFVNGSVQKRAAILTGLRCFSSVDVWLERLFDATEYPPHTQVFMSNALVSVCEKELECSRAFSLTKLFDFLTVCASICSRMQWRDLWINASKVFILAGKMSFDIASSALGGLRIIALSYLKREELLNYSFQKEVLSPFEAILMGNQDVRIRQKVIEAISELIEIRGSHLASGWNVTFSILSHSAVIPEVVKSAWDVCQSIITSHVSLMKDCFKDLVFCLTSFACNNVDEDIALLSISYLRACGHWLQFGLELPPEDVRSATAVAEWAGRFKDSDNEARASQLVVGLSRVTLSIFPITSHRNLEKPTSLTEKTSFHLWMSILEGMVPIILVHSSVRVRAHVICSLWALIGQYATAFSTDIQDSLFKGILRPVIFVFLTHASVEQETTINPVDYKLLTFLSFKSMFLACHRHAHLLTLACETFEKICASPVSLEHVRAGLVDVILRICVDLEQSGYVTYRDLQSTTSELWVSRLMHELVQLGYIDVIHFKRTSGWSELHGAVAVTSSAIKIDTKDEIMRTRVTNMIVTSIVDGIVAQLLVTMQSCNFQQDYLLCCKAMRQAYLVMALFSSADLTESVFPMLLSRISSSALTIPEEQLLIPYLYVLVEFVFILRSSPPTSNEARELRIALNAVCQTVRQSRDFCIRHQDELISALENDRSESEVLPVSKKHKGRTFVDVFRSGKAPLTSRVEHISRTLLERVLHEWRYLLSVLGLKYAFAFGGVTVQCTSANTVRDLIMLIPSELEERLIKPFFMSCCEELGIGIDLGETSTISLFLTVLGQKINMLSASEVMVESG